MFARNLLLGKSQSPAWENQSAIQPGSADGAITVGGARAPGDASGAGDLGTTAGRARIAAGEYEALPQVVKWSRGVSSLRLEVAAEVSLWSRRREDEAFALDFKRVVEWPDASPRDYLPSVHALPGEGGCVVTALRFERGPEGTLVPWVEVVLGAGRIAGADSGLLHGLKEHVVRTYSRFRPGSLRAFFWADKGMPAGFAPHTAFVAGMVQGRNSEDRPRPRTENGRVCLREPKDLAFYGAYQDIYRHFHRLRPDLRAKVPMEPLWVFEEAQSRGMLREVLVDGVWAGVYATEPRVMRHVAGHYFTEKCVDPRHWGTGLGRAAEDLFLAQLPRGSWILGDIAMANTPSLRSALSQGRRVLGWMAEMRWTSRQGE